MGKVDDTKHAEDQREAKGEERVNPAKRYRVNYLLSKQRIYFFMTYLLP